MKLSKKTFFYSISISVVIVGMILLYFIYMLPSLYVDYMKKSNLESVIAMEKGYIESRSYKGLNVKNPTGAFTLEMPYQGNQIYLTGKGFQFTVEVRDERLLEEMEKLTGALKEPDHFADLDEDFLDTGLIKEILAPENILDKDYPLGIQVSTDQTAELFTNENDKMHIVSDDLIVYEGSVEDDNNQYMTYMAIGSDKDAVVISFLPVMTPQMKEIKPIVLESVPMIAAVIFLIVLISSQFFSKKIVNPIIRLAGFAEDVQSTEALDISPFAVKQKDEIGELGNALNELYRRLGENYQQLEEKNEILRQENKRREVFLRASSHQLKTPVAAALLLVEGMTGEVGKYKDTKKYLPQVKEKLCEMGNIIDNILYLNHCTENMHLERIEWEPVVREVLSGYAVQTEDKSLTVEVSGKAGSIKADRELLIKIVDNLVSNAVAYTEAGGRIDLLLKPEGIGILNYGARIQEDMKDHIYEPFVSSDTGKKGKGLGLYIASYYASILGLQITVDNIEEGVLASIVPENGRPVKGESIC